jgi:hypothetical protein
MDPQPHIVSVPSIDVSYYLGNMSGYFASHWPAVFYFIKQIVGILVGVSIPLSLFFLIAIVITVEGLKKVRAKEEEMFMKPPEDAKKAEKADDELAKRWRKVVEHADSNNENDWKQAIIEADIMLEQLVTKLGYQGDSVGEKLKRASRGDFKSLDQAWEAHKVRNRIAHDGSSFDINQLEAKRVIGLFRQVFDEFYHISEK